MVFKMIKTIQNDNGNEKRILNNKVRIEFSPLGLIRKKEHLTHELVLLFKRFETKEGGS